MTGTPSIFSRHFALLASALALAACGDTPPGSGEPSRVIVVAGDAQRGPPGTELPIPLQFRVVDPSRHPVAGVTLQLSVTAGAGSVPQAELITDDQGVARVYWTLGPAAGTQRLQARAEDVAPAEVTAVTCPPAECGAANAGIFSLVPLATYDGSGQTVHPDVAVGAGALAGFWLAITPYPRGDANFENPSIFTANDGTKWSAPDGLVNPVEHPTAGAYLSDPDVVYDEPGGRLWMFYRNVANERNIVEVTRSTDGVRWDTPVAIISVPSHQLVSPAIVRGAPGAPWTMWSVNAGPVGCAAGSTTVDRRTSADGLHWGNPATTDLSQPGQVIWHIDVEWIPLRAEFWAVYNSYQAGGSCATDALYLARSADGMHWTTSPSPVARRGITPAFADLVYRSTFRTDPLAGTVTFWLSGAAYNSATGYVWQTATVTHRISDLLAAIATPRPALAAPQRRDLPAPERDTGPG